MEAHDLYLVIGCIVAGLSIPSLIGAWADRRVPWVAALAGVVGAVLIWVAVSRAPDGLALNQVPDSFIRVVAYLIR